jgi:hypothetical protein
VEPGTRQDASAGHLYRNPLRRGRNALTANGLNAARHEDGHHVCVLTTEIGTGCLDAPLPCSPLEADKLLAAKKCAAADGERCGAETCGAIGRYRGMVAATKSKVCKTLQAY